MCDINIMDVVARNNIQLISSGGISKRAICPFCGNKGALSITPSKGKYGQFNCFSCAKQGNAIDMEMELNPLDYISNDGGTMSGAQLMKKMADNLGCYSSNVHYEEVEEIPLKSKEYISKVYLEMLNLLKLTPKHKSDLEKKRGLTEEYIKLFRFKSISKNDSKWIGKKLSQEFDLKGVPGFYLKEGKWVLHVPVNGILCPAYQDGLLMGFQIRADVPIGKNKYFWISSGKFAADCGTSSGSPYTVLISKESKCVIITEGILKASIIYALLDKKVSVIGIPGKDNMGQMPSIIKKPALSGSYFFEAFDMDKYITVETAEEIALNSEMSDELKKAVRDADNVMKATIKLISLIDGYGIPYHQLKWDFSKEGNFWNGNYKGLDDFLIAYKKSDVFVNYLINKEEQYNALKNYI